MNKINALHSEIDVTPVNKLLTTNITKLTDPDGRGNSNKEVELFLDVDIEFCGLRSEMEVYRANLVKSQLFLEAYHELKRKNLRSNFFPIKMR